MSRSRTKVGDIPEETERNRHCDERNLVGAGELVELVPSHVLRLGGPRHVTCIRYAATRNHLAYDFPLHIYPE